MIQLKRLMIDCNYINTINLATINDTNIFIIIHMNTRSIVCNFDSIITFLNSYIFILRL